MRRFGGVQVNGRSAGAAECRNNFSGDVSRFAEPGYDQFAWVGSDQVDRLRKVAVELPGGARDGFGLDQHSPPGGFQVWLALHSRRNHHRIPKEFWTSRR